MRAALIGVLILFAARQAVAFTDCCCESFCRNPNASCDSHDHPPRPEKSDCCKGEGAEQPEPEACTHLAPSSEVVESAPAQAPAPSPALLLPDLPVTTSPPARRETDRPDSCTRGSPPLHLRNHVLLI